MSIHKCILIFINKIINKINYKIKNINLVINFIIVYVDKANRNNYNISTK